MNNFKYINDNIAYYSNKINLKINNYLNNFFKFMKFNF